MKFLTSIDLSQNEIQNAIMQPLAAPPANPKIGQIYFNSIDLTLYLWTGEKWIPVPTKDLAARERQRLYHLRRHPRGRSSVHDYAEDERHRRRRH